MRLFSGMFSRLTSTLVEAHPYAVILVTDQQLVVATRL